MQSVALYAPCMHDRIVACVNSAGGGARKTHTGRTFVYCVYYMGPSRVMRLACQKQLNKCVVQCTQQRHLLRFGGALGEQEIKVQHRREHAPLVVNRRRFFLFVTMIVMAHPHHRLSR